MSDDLTARGPLVSSLPLQGERVAFTGTLASMTHRQAHELVEEQGGQAAVTVSRHVTMMVVGEEGWPLDLEGRTSVRLQQAVDLINQGHQIRIINESDWLRLIGLEQREREVASLQTPAMLQQLFGLPVSLTRRWERLGLIHAVQRVYRLPYFDYREVASVRKLYELLKTGISRSQIESSLAALQDLLPGVERPLAQLEILERDARIVVRDEASLVDLRSGQRLFDFEPSTAGDSEGADGVPVSVNFSDAVAGLNADRKVAGADEFQTAYSRGCRLLDAGDAAGAVEAFRLALMDAPADPELNFQLADALFRQNNLHGALERFHVAVEHDHDFIEAWTQLGCVRHLLSDSAGALDAFEIALSSHPTYPDALFQKASVLAELGRHPEACAFWAKYLEQDDCGPWADVARQRLEQLHVAAGSPTEG